MQLPIHIVNAFARGAFTGNPAAVIVTETALEEHLMQAIAAQNNLAETAYVVTGTRPRGLRWFTPSTEVDLCGHATLAAAYVLWNSGAADTDRLNFNTASGEVGVSRREGLLQLDFPARPVTAAEIDRDPIGRALGCPVDAIRAISDGKVLTIELIDQGQVEALAPNFANIAQLHDFAVVVTAPGEDVDFVARFFAPNAGIDEDPVTGSAYTILAPYWAAKLGRERFSARQLSARGGWIECHCAGDRVLIAGAVEPYLSGNIRLP